MPVALNRVLIDVPEVSFLGLCPVANAMNGAKK